MKIVHRNSIFAKDIANDIHKLVNLKYYNYVDGSLQVFNDKLAFTISGNCIKLRIKEKIISNELLFVIKSIIELASFENYSFCMTNYMVLVEQNGKYAILTNESLINKYKLEYNVTGFKESKNYSKMFEYIEIENKKLYFEYSSYLGTYIYVNNRDTYRMFKNKINLKIFYKNKIENKILA